MSALCVAHSIKRPDLFAFITVRIHCGMANKYLMKKKVKSEQKSVGKFLVEVSVYKFYIIHLVFVVVLGTTRI